MKRCPVNREYFYITEAELKVLWEIARMRRMITYTPTTSDISTTTGGDCARQEEFTDYMRAWQRKSGES